MEDNVFKKILNQLEEEGLLDEDPERTERLKQVIAHDEEKDNAKEPLKQPLMCPCCKSRNHKKVEKRQDNGVCGPGYSSWVVSSYYVCKDCGVMFQDPSKL